MNEVQATPTLEPKNEVAAGAGPSVAKTNLDLLKECRDNTKSLGQAFGVAESNDYNSALDGSKKELESCLDVSNLVLKDFKDSPQISSLTKAVNSTQDRIEVQLKIINEMKALRSDAGRSSNTQEKIALISSALGIFEQKETIEWKQLSIRAANPLTGFSFYNVSVIIVLIIIFTRILIKNNKKEIKK